MRQCFCQQPATYMMAVPGHDSEAEKFLSPSDTAVTKAQGVPSEFVLV